MRQVKKRTGTGPAETGVIYPFIRSGDVHLAGVMVKTEVV